MLLGYDGQVYSLSLLEARPDQKRRLNIDFRKCKLDCRSMTSNPSNQDVGQHEHMKRINVIGTTGSGKSTFSKQLADKLGFPCIHMDQLFWKPNWEGSSDEEFIPKVTEATSGEKWVLDGNYNRTNDAKWKNVDTIIWLDYSYPRTFWQLLTRTVSRIITQEELWPGTGNRDSFRMAFMSKNSIFVWLFLRYKRNKERYSDLHQSLELKHIQFIRLLTPKDAKKFLGSVSVRPTE